MPTLNVVTDTIVVQTAAQWAVDATVYINRQILVTSDAYYGSTDFRKFKIADGTQTWANLQDLPFLSAVPTLAQVLTAGQTVGAQGIYSNNSLNYLLLLDAYIALGFDDGLGALSNLSLTDAEAQINFLNNVASGFFKVTETESGVQHDVKINFDAPNVNLPQETASLILSTDASKNIKGLATTTYPSLTELAYVKGVTSAIQTQLNAKLTSANIVETITNGVTTNAPSENAVFDALSLKPKIELMFGTTTVFSPADSTTTYVTIATNLAVNTNASLRQFQGISGTVYGFWAYVDPQAIIGSNEAVTYNLRNVTDATSSLLGTLSYDARGRSILMNVATPIVLDDTKFYSIELVFPAFGTNPTNVATLGKILIR